MYDGFGFCSVCCVAFVIVVLSRHFVGHHGKAVVAMESDHSNYSLIERAMQFGAKAEKAKEDTGKTVSKHG